MKSHSRLPYLLISLAALLVILLASPAFATYFIEVSASPNELQADFPRSQTSTIIATITSIDAGKFPPENVTVAFQVVSGPGSVNPTLVSTTSQGIATSTYTLPLDTPKQTITIRGSIVKPSSPSTILASDTVDITLTPFAAYSIGASVRPQGLKAQHDLEQTSTVTVNLSSIDTTLFPISGKTISFSISQGPGTLSSASGTTDSSGIATTIYTLPINTAPQITTIRASFTYRNGPTITADTDIVIFNVEIRAEDGISPATKYIGVGQTTKFTAAFIPREVVGRFRWRLRRERDFAVITAGADQRTVSVKGLAPSMTGKKNKAQPVKLKLMFKPDGAPDWFNVANHEFIVFDVRIANVNATDPRNSKVNYLALPPDIILNSATFVFKGIPQTKTNVSGDFDFSYDQSALPIGNNTIQLKAKIGGVAKDVLLTATRTEKRGPIVTEFAVGRVLIKEGAFIIPVTHELFEIWHIISYSALVIPGSKTVWVGETHVNLIREKLDVLPSEIGIWLEDHYYKDNDGRHLRKAMDPVTEPTLPPQGPHFRSKKSSEDFFFKPNNSLTGAAQIVSIQFESDSGLVLWVPAANTTIEKPLD